MGVLCVAAASCAALVVATSSYVPTARAAKKVWMLDVSDYPKEMRKAYDVYIKKCSKCHSLTRAAPGLTKDSKWWKGYLRKMMRMSGSGINKPTAKTILEFAKFYASKKKGDDEDAQQ